MNVRGRGETDAGTRGVGAAVAVVAIAGSGLGGWRFDGLAEGPLPFGIAVVAVAVGASLHARDG